jgi:hypothetical protein
VTMVVSVEEFSSSRSLVTLTVTLAGLTWASALRRIVRLP